MLTLFLHKLADILNLQQPLYGVLGQHLAPESKLDRPSFNGCPRGKPLWLGIQGGSGGRPAREAKADGVR